MMSTESKTRPYRKRRRAEQEQETRLRITEAAVDLHGSVGPARTTVSAVADRADVQRATVYRHFPDERALFAACSAHYMALNPPPDLTAWVTVADPDDRLRKGLEELYDWYEHNERMLANTTRDVALVPALRESMEALGSFYDAATDVLVAGRPERGARRRRAKAAIAHALAFQTWRSLVREQELSPDEAVKLMAGLAAAA